MNIEVIPVDDDLKKNIVEEEIRDSFSYFFEQDIFFRNVGIACYHKQKKTLVFFNPKSDFVFFFDIELNDFLIFFVKYLNKKEIDIALSYDILRIAQKLAFTETEYFEIFRFINWQTSKKGLEFFLAMNNFSEILKNMVLMKRVSINDAYLFHKYFQSDYDGFLKNIPENLSYSNCGKILRYSFEYSKSKSKPIKYLEEKLNGSNDIVGEIFKIRFPEYSFIMQSFSDFIKSLKLPNKTKITFDQSFENQDYKLEIEFTDFKSLYEKIKIIDKNLDIIKSGKYFSDKFNHDFLFEKKDSDD
jgi:hypothetical protein